MWRETGERWPSLDRLSQMAGASNHRWATHLLYYFYISAEFWQEAFRTPTDGCFHDELLSQAHTPNVWWIHIKLNTITVASPHTSSKTNLTAVQTQLAFPESGWANNEIHFTIIKQANVKVFKSLCHNPIYHYGNFSDNCLKSNRLDRFCRLTFTIGFLLKINIKWAWSVSKLTLIEVQRFSSWSLLVLDVRAKTWSGHSSLCR